MMDTAAATIVGPRSIEVRPQALPEPGPGQVRIALEGCGLCGSELPVWEGRPWFDYPLEAGAPGHEGWGRVDALGEGVDGVSLGQRVAAISYNAHAHHDLASSEAVVPLPPELDDEPFPGEALACAMNVFRRCDVQRDHSVAVLGVGFLGSLLVRLLADAGARVIAIARRPSGLEIARRMGAAETVQASDQETVLRRVEELTGGALCEVVVEVTGKQEPLSLAARLTAERGRLVIAGFHQDGARQVDMQLWNWRGLDVINAHERDPAVYVRGLREAVDAVLQGRLDPAPLYTHIYPLECLSDAFEVATARPDGFMKALVTI